MRTGYPGLSACFAHLALGWRLIAPPLGRTMRNADTNVLHPYVLMMVLVQMKRLMDVPYLLLPLKMLIVNC